ncbi:hypothetical protein D3C81_1198350 [compost metagenome]
MAGNRLRQANGGEEFFRDAVGLLRVVDVAEDHHELIGTVAKHRVRIAHAGQQLSGDPFEHLVTRRMAQRIVDALEAIQTEKHHHQLFVMPSAHGHGLTQAITEQGAVGQLREAVVLQQVRDLEQFVHPRLDGPLKAEHLQRRVLRQLPFPGQGIGHLADFQTVERLFQDQQLIAELQPFGHRFPAVVAVRRAQGDLQVRVDTPQLLDGFQAIPAGRHAHVDKGEGVGIATGQCAIDQCQRFLALIGGVELEAQVRRLLAAEQRLLQLLQIDGVRHLRGEDLAKVIVDRRRVIDDQDTPVGLRKRRFHASSSFGARRQLSLSNCPACSALTAALKYMPRALGSGGAVGGVHG